MLGFTLLVAGLRLLMRNVGIHSSCGRRRSPPPDVDTSGLSSRDEQVRLTLSDYGYHSG